MPQILRLFVATTISGCILASSLYADNVLEPEENNRSTIKNFANNLLRQRDSIFSGELNVSLLIAFSLPPFTEVNEPTLEYFLDKELPELIASDLNETELQDEILKFCLKVGLKQEGWTSLKIVQDGDKIRNDYFGESQTNKSYVRSPEGDLNYSETSNTTTRQSGHSMLKMYGVDDLRFIPSRVITENLTENSKLFTTKRNKYRLIKEPWLELEFDPQTAFIYRGRITPRGSANFTKYWQFAPIKIKNTLLPRLVCILSGSTKKDSRISVRFLKFYLLRNATLNIPIPKNAFDVSVPSGSRVYVTNDDGEKVLSAKVGKDVSDINGLIDKAIAEKEPKKDESSNIVRKYPVLIFVNIFAVIILIIFMKIRRKSSATSSKQ